MFIPVLINQAFFLSKKKKIFLVALEVEYG